MNINIENFIPTPLSSALATLNSDDKLLGGICIDLGASSSSMAIFENEKLIFLDAINIGGDNITKDIAKGISTNLESAERLKTLYGSVISSPSDEHELIEVPAISGENNQFNQINRSTVNSIIKPRIEETLEMVWQKIKQKNLDTKKIKNVVLTGGGSQLEGIIEYAKIIFSSNVRIGKPQDFIGLESKLSNPSFADILGTILYNRQDYEIKYLGKDKKNKKKLGFSGFLAWLDQYI